MELDINDLRELLTAVNETNITEFILKSNDLELTIRRPSVTTDGAIMANFSGISADLASTLSNPLIPAVNPPNPSTLSSTPTPATPSSPPVPPPLERRFADIVSPMVGTFYRAPAPDEAPFVEVGDRVRNGQTVCIIEAMKLMNELEAEVSGEIIEILVSNGEPIEYGQVLMRVNPS
ncbi:MAG: acetyl-CoA carboxylase biotin carboxyl carrier protein [Cyanobacteria bacterium WB6_1B_304]|nr:acetyl-CoA carboxylase biotin carboxyl carrier protein [Cyanobacteria bacterium WB6_1B_304]